ncbi:MAG: hypothetical protein JST01_17530 [Cyanobacteria bacterium SZAS TMP-1]|nr:hypothetical protein [Cyanobacteria bacterium SZAS TMP-1]
MNKIEQAAVAVELAPRVAAAGIKLAEEYVGSNAVSKAVVRVGERVEVLAADATKMVGDLFLYRKIPDGPMVALVKLSEPTKLAAKAPVGEVSFLTPKYWRDKTGAVFETNKPFSADDLPGIPNLKHAPDWFAPERSLLRLANGENAFLQSEIQGIGANGKLIRANAGDQTRFLAALGEAPKMRFTGSPLWEGLPESIFNPERGTTNCMGCTASVVRTWRNGELTTSGQIPKLRTSFGDSLGTPAPGSFEDYPQALKWFGDAAGVSLKSVGWSIENIVPGRLHAADILLKGGASEQRHMAFAYRFQGSKPFIYDGQSGVQYHLDSLTQSKTSVIFHQLKPLPEPLYK